MIGHAATFVGLAGEDRPGLRHLHRAMTSKPLDERAVAGKGQRCVQRLLQSRSLPRRMASVLDYTVLAGAAHLIAQSP